MGKTKKPVYWVVDNSTYQKLQPLKRFVDFVAGLPYSTELHKRNAEEIKGLIETINQPETIKEWCVCLNIYDPMVQAGYSSGNYWKKGGSISKREYCKLKQTMKFLTNNIFPIPNQIIMAVSFLKKKLPTNGYGWISN